MSTMSLRLPLTFQSPSRLSKCNLSADAPGHSAKTHNTKVKLVHCPLSYSYFVFIIAYILNPSCGVSLLFLIYCKFQLSSDLKNKICPQRQLIYLQPFFTDFTGALLFDRLCSLQKSFHDDTLLSQLSLFHKSDIHILEYLLFIYLST